MGEQDDVSKQISHDVNMTARGLACPARSPPPPPKSQQYTTRYLLPDKTHITQEKNTMDPYSDQSHTQHRDGKVPSPRQKKHPFVLISACGSAERDQGADPERWEHAALHRGGLWG